MFWNDPNLYGASLPYREIGHTVQTPILGPVVNPWQNIPRFLPQTYYGLGTPFVNVPPVAFNPMLHQGLINPFAMQQHVNPLMHQGAIHPFMMQQPLLHQGMINPLMMQQHMMNPLIGFRPFV